VIKYLGIMDIWVFIPLLNWCVGRMCDLSKNKQKGDNETDERGKTTWVKTISEHSGRLHRDDKDTYWGITSLVGWKPSPSQLPQQGASSK
jgi:hypothetical protein